MEHSNVFIDVLKAALDDSKFRKALAKDLLGTLEAKGLRAKLSKKELAELQKIFAEPEVKGQEAGSIACGYRGYNM